MKLSTKGRYGVRLMLDLALNQNNGPTVLKDIAERQEISEKYLWHLITPLKTAGLIHSIRGAHGGYTLAKPLSKITLKEIVCVLEGPLSLVDCVTDASICNRSQSCVSRDIWKNVSEKIAQTLESITLEDIVKRHNHKIASSTTYNI